MPDVTVETKRIVRINLRVRKRKGSKLIKYIWKGDYQFVIFNKYTTLGSQKKTGSKYGMEGSFVILNISYGEVNGFQNTTNIIIINFVLGLRK